MERDRRKRERAETAAEEDVPVAAPAAAILGLQQTAGNAAVAQLLSRKANPDELTGVKANKDRVSVKPPEAGHGLKFLPEPAGLAGVKWKLEGDGGAVDAGTTIAADGSVTISDAQTGGRVKGVGEKTDAEGTSTFEQPISFVEDPGAITSTSESANSTDTRYQGEFTHTFKAGAAAERAHVNEKFTGPLISKPDSSSHTIKSPFGEFTLAVNDPASKTDGWDLDGAGSMIAPDHVSIDKSLVDARKFIPNASNPTAPGLPQGFEVTQGLHALRQPSQTYGATPVATTPHVRTLRETSGTLEVVLSSGGKEVVETYDGPAVFRKATVDQASVEVSTAAVTNTVSISAESFGKDPTAHYRIEGPKLGCSVDASGTLTIGTKPGVVKVRVGDAKFANYDEVSVTITAPKAAEPKPAASGEGAPAWADPESE